MVGAWVSGHEFERKNRNTLQFLSHYQSDVSFEERTGKNEHRGRAGKARGKIVALSKI
jgi:hypothetical protein